MNATMRTTFSRFGATEWKTFSTPLANLSESEVMVLLMNWTTKVTTRNVHNLKLRLRDTVNQEVYEIWIKKPKGRMRLIKMQKRDDLKCRKLYEWTPTTYNNLTRAKLERSMRNADQNK